LFDNTDQEIAHQHQVERLAMQQTEVRVVIQIVVDMSDFLPSQITAGSVVVVGLFAENAAELRLQIVAALCLADNLSTSIFHF
jgi:hypothetical protein